MKPLRIAIVGATGLVGRKFLTILDHYQIPIASLKLFASETSIGHVMTFRNEPIEIQGIEKGCFNGIDVTLFSAGNHVSKRYAPQALEEGSYVIDNSSAFRMDDDVPLIVPEVNMSDVKDHKLIANPNCSTIQCMYPLHILNQAFGIVDVDYHTYQAVSGAGQKGVNDLYDDEISYFSYDINETVIPHIDDFLKDGYTKEEHKMMNETKKILHMPNLSVSATCVRVPVHIGHAVSLKVTLKRDVDINLIRQTLKKHEHLIVLDEPEALRYPTMTHAKHRDVMFVGRLRKDLHDPKKILLFITADNIRKGAATNAIQIMRSIFDESYIM